MKSHQTLLRDDMAAFLSEASAGRVDLPKLLVEFRIGDEFTGLTDLEVQGAGRSRIKSNVTRNRTLIWHVGDLTGPEVSRLVEVLRDNELWALPFDDGPGRPHDRRVWIAVRYESQAWSRPYWHDAIAADPRYHRIEEHVFALARHLSNGAILE